MTRACNNCNRFQRRDCFVGVDLKPTEEESAIFIDVVPEKSIKIGRPFNVGTDAPGNPIAKYNLSRNIWSRGFNAMSKHHLMPRCQRRWFSEKFSCVSQEDMTLSHKYLQQRRGFTCALRDLKSFLVCVLYLFRTFNILDTSLVIHQLQTSYE